MDWRDRAACLDVDPELFFPIGNTGPALAQIDEAKAVCRTCPVVDRPPSAPRRLPARLTSARRSAVCRGRLGA